MRRAGTLGAALVFFCTFTGRNFYLNSMTTWGYPAWQLALLIQIVAWGLQVTTLFRLLSNLGLTQRWTEIKPFCFSRWDIRRLKVVSLL